MHDAHCHFNSLPAARAAHPTAAVTCRPSDFAATQAQAETCAFLHPALGLIPQEAAQLEAELPLFLELLPRARFVGEVGLDGVSQDASGRAAQARAFAAILEACRAEAAAGRRKVLSIHSRRAASAVLDALGEGFPGTAILHWFSGTADELRRAIGMGCFFSVNPAMVKSASGRALIRLMPPERVLLESDAPFVEGDLAQVVAHLASVWGVPQEQAERAVDGAFARITRDAGFCAQGS